MHQLKQIIGKNLTDKELCQEILDFFRNEATKFFIIALVAFRVTSKIEQP